MSTRIITKKCYQCTCELCRKVWDTKELRIPPRCPGCGSYRWNGVDRRRVDTKPEKARTTQA